LIIWEPYSQYRTLTASFLTGWKEKQEIHSEALMVFLIAAMIFVELTRKKGN